MKKYFSISMIANKLLVLAKRFPISIMLVVGFACLLFMSINLDAKNIPYQHFIFLSFGAIIGVTATLWLECFAKTLVQYIITIVLILLWGVYCFFLPEENSLHTNKIIELVVIGSVAFLSLFFISFLKKGKDKAFWKFTIHTVFQFGVAVFFSGILFGGLCLAFFAMKELFNIRIDDDVFGNLAIFCFVLFAPLYFMANIPDKIAKYNEEIRLNKFLKILALYILTPLAVLYIVILYLYLFKIIFTWDLPNGWVSWLVSILASVGLLIITLLYPLRLEGKNKFVVVLSRYFGLILLPLLLLMTTGIFRRIGDYGLTIHRGYILLLNIWFYGIYIYIFITKSQRIKWVFISAAVIALFVSVGFWSIPNVTKHILTTEVNNYLDNKKIDISDKAFFDGMEQERKDKIRDKIDYLYHRYGKESVQPFYSDSIRTELGYYTYLTEPYIYNEKEEKGEWITFSAKHNKVCDIEQFNTFVSIKYYPYRSQDYDKHMEYSQNKDGLIMKIIPDNRVYSVSLKELMTRHLDNEYSKNNDIKDEIGKIYEDKANNFTILIYEFRGNYYRTTDSLYISSFEGYLFYNK